MDRIAAAVKLADGTGWKVDDTTFVHAYGSGSTPECFLLRKPASLVELYLELAARFQQANIVELGIAAGGSTALISLVARPRKLISCELSPEPVGALASFIEAHDLLSIVKPYYGVDQADAARLASIVDSELDGEPLDLVIDDASHLHDETRSSFETLYPRLRPGGLYIIEDWAADFRYAARMATTLSDASPSNQASRQQLMQAIIEHPGGQTPLPRLGVELLQVCGTSSDVISELTINKHWIVVKRGVASLDAGTFRMRDHFTDHWGWLAD
ncbi:MAG: class I SAM-dependent methyltransferase [Actinomycetota bacterium]